MKNFDELVELLSEKSLSSFVKKNAKRAISPSSWLHGAGNVAGILKDPYNPKGAERVASALHGAANILSPDPSKSWSDTETPATLDKKSKSPSTPSFKEGDYFYTIINNKTFAGKITKITGEYVFVKLFKHPEYGSVVALVKQRTPQLFFYKEKIPKGKSRYIDYTKAAISYNPKKRQWIAVTK
jgi:hypothetical protein